MAQAQLPGQQAQRSFSEKLDKFRGTLSQDEQRVLDGMMAATGPQQSGDVEGYEWFYSGPQYVPSTSSRNPYWYNGSGAAAWNGTPWGTTIGGLQQATQPWNP